MRPLNSSILLFMYVLITLDASAEVSVPKVFWGEARDKEQKLVYREHHLLGRSKDGALSSVTSFFDSTDKRIAKLTSDYSTNPWLPVFAFHSDIDGYEEGVSMVDTKEIVTFRKRSPTSKVETQVIERHDKQTTGQGFDRFIQDHIDELNTGKMVEVFLILPARLAEYSFLLSKVSGKGDKILVNLEINHWLLRLFAPKIETEYDIKNKWITSYHGPSNVRDASQRNPLVTIKYHYGVNPSPRGLASDGDDPQAKLRGGGR